MRSRISGIGRTPLAHTLYPLFTVAPGLVRWSIPQGLRSGALWTTAINRLTHGQRKTLLDKALKELDRREAEERDRSETQDCRRTRGKGKRVHSAMATIANEGAN